VTESTSGDPAAAETATRNWIWHFGSCQLDGRTLELRVDGQPAKLEPKPLELLLHLLRHQGEVVTKDELQDAVWPGRILSESVLTKAVAKLRDALADDEQQTVKTVHGYGYRLAAPVRVEAAAVTNAQPLLGFAAGDTPPHRPHWRFERRLGSGGYGEAWLAEHDKTRERRVFKFGLDSGGLAALKREITLSRVLAQTYGERRDWVRVLDWNLEEPPFFIETEYAAGGDLPTFAEAQGGLAAIALTQRIEWLAQAAEGLSAAHAAGVLHKDLKPANLLIDTDASGQIRIKLADFGSGRLLDPEHLERLRITRLGFTGADAASDSGDSGTPLYVAPERLAGQQPTVQSDIYALGILLYQLIVGDLKRPLAPGWESEIADPLLREDVRAAAAGDPQLRLRDAAELAQRLRTLDERRARRARDEATAVEAARLRAALERARIRRGWAWLSAGVFAAATAVTITMLLQLRVANRQVETERGIATAVNEFMVTDLIGAADPLTTGLGELSIREVLDRGAAAAGARFAGQPRAEAAVRHALGRSYLGVGEYRPALTQFDLAVELAGAAEPADRAQVASASMEALTALSHLDDWNAVRNRLHTLTDATDPAVRLRARLFEARTRLQENDLDGSVAAFATLLPEYEDRFPNPSEPLAELHDYYGHALRERGDFADAIRHSATAVAMRSALYGDDHFRVIDTRHTLGATHYLAGRLDEALAIIEPGVARAERVLGADHHRTLIMKIDLGTLRQARGELLEAERLFATALESLQRQFGEDHEDVRTVLNNLGLLYDDEGLDRPDLELEYLKRAHESNLRAVGERDLASIVTTNNYARAFARAGRWAEAEALQSRNVAIAAELLPADNWQLAVMRNSWANQLAHLGRRDEAAALFEQTIDVLTQQLGVDHPQTRSAVERRDKALGPRAASPLHDVERSRDANRA
jgi:eukaryotic-like serine/threonine-protein kinase